MQTYLVFEVLIRQSCSKFGMSVSFYDGSCPVNLEGSTLGISRLAWGSMITLKAWRVVVTRRTRLAQLDSRMLLHVLKVKRLSFNGDGRS